jgi:PiT family inorganic phosphate transporter
MGAGAAKRVSAVRWGVAGNIVVAWVLTLPASAAVGAVTYAVVYLLGAHSAGPIVVSIALVLALIAVLVRRATGPRPLAAEA